MMDTLDTLVVGAGVIGLAVARALSLAGREVVVVEREPSFGTGISSRNSEVVHAGLYDAPGSLKASLCVEGNPRLYGYCAERGVPHRRCGKLVVATNDAERTGLERLAANATANGVQGLRLVDASAVRTMEPDVRAVAALVSESSGIVDTHALMTALLADAEAAGASLAVASRVTAVERVDDRWRVHVRTGADMTTVDCTCVVNAAGLGAQDLARSIDGFPQADVPPLFPAKGHYFTVGARTSFTHLVYPMPVDGGLGVHLTLDLGGQARFGPDVEWLPLPFDEARADYAVDARRVEAFAAAIRRYWPALPHDALAPAYTGIRPKLSGPGQPKADFRIDGPEHHGVPGLVNLFGIESPGITASLAIAERVSRIVCEDVPA